VDGYQSWKLALETSANFVATRASFRRADPARVLASSVMGIRILSSFSALTFDP